MEWQLKTTPPSKIIVTPRVLVHGEIPVFLSATGYYSEFVSSAGDSSCEHPHVMVSLAESTIHGPDGSDRWVNSVYVSAVGEQKIGRRQILPVVSSQACRPARTDAEVQALIDSLAPQIAEALDLCERIDVVYADAAQRTAVIRQVEAQCATREGYEAACETAEVEALPDEEISRSYGIAYGQFSFPEYSPEVIIKMALARHRKRALEAEARVQFDDRAPERPVAIPVKAGQLWEPCRCGREPVYMPLHLCDTCWPKGV